MYLNCLAQCPAQGKGCTNTSHGCYQQDPGEHNPGSRADTPLPRRQGRRCRGHLPQRCWRLKELLPDLKADCFKKLSKKFNSKSEDISTWTPDHVPALSSEAHQASLLWAAGPGPGLWTLGSWQAPSSAGSGPRPHHVEPRRWLPGHRRQ